MKKNGVNRVNNTDSKMVTESFEISNNLRAFYGDSILLKGSGLLKRWEG